jgi:hypothetical protein
MPGPADQILAARLLLREVCALLAQHGDLFAPFGDDELVQEGLRKMAAKFRNEEDDGPRLVADVESQMGETRAMRKLAVFTRVHEFMTALKASSA